MKTAEEYLRPYVGPNPPHLIYYASALAAVQAVIDHYDPLPGKLELVYRVIDPPELPRVFAPSCPRCTQRRDQCICPAREEPPF